MKQRLILLGLISGITAFADPLVLANYYAWYHTDEGHQGWTRPGGEKNAKALAVQRPGEPVLASAAYPLIGPYDSANSVVAAWHVKLAKAAGIDAFLVDWWGTHKGRDANIDAGILPAVESLGFKFALLDERAQFHHDWKRYKASALAALKRYEDSPAYLKIDGKPVYYLYQVAAAPTLTPAKFADLRQDVEAALGPVYWIVNTIAHAHGEPPAKQKRIPHDWLATAGVDAFGFYSTFSNFRAHRYDELIGKYRYLSGLAHDAGKKMLLPVHPGHDNSHFRDDPYIMPRRNGQTLRDYLRAATDAKADFVMITSWNEWPETTVIEPSSSWPDPYLYLRILAEWCGQSFTPPTLPLLFGDSAQAREPDANEAQNN